MRNPTNDTERRIFKESCISSYKQEMIEINEWAPNVEDIYYSDHLGVWIVTFKVGDDQEFDTKEELIKSLKFDLIKDYLEWVKGNDTPKERQPKKEKE